MTPTEIARSIRHWTEFLAGGGDVGEAVDALHALAEEVDPGSGKDLEAYIVEEDADDDRSASYSHGGDMRLVGGAVPTWEAHIIEEDADDEDV